MLAAADHRKSARPLQKEARGAGKETRGRNIDARKTRRMEMPAVRQEERGDIVNVKEEEARACKENEVEKG